MGNGLILFGAVGFTGVAAFCCFLVVYLVDYSMNFKPEGLTLPDCECFRKKAKAMNAAIDSLAAMNIIQIRAAIIYRKDGDKGQMCFEDYSKEYEAAYDRLRPLVMQRLQYADGVTLGVDR